MQVSPHALPVVQMRQHELAWRGAAVTTNGAGVATKAVRTTVGAGVAGRTVAGATVAVSAVGAAAGAAVAADVAIAGEVAGVAHAVVPSAMAMKSSE